jgi:hypothetical protein
MNIVNLCSNIKLVSPVYFGNGVVFPKLSDQQIYIGTKMNASFEINTTQDDFKGALLYKLQRYSDSQYSMENDKNKAAHVYMLTAWKMVDKKPFVRIVLVEHAKEFIWNEEKLKKWYDKNHAWLEEFDSNTSDTWFMDDSMVLKTSFKARILKKVLELIVFISEEEKSDHAVKPLCVDFER